MVEWAEQIRVSQAWAQTYSSDTKWLYEFEQVTKLCFFQFPYLNNDKNQKIEYKATKVQFMLNKRQFIVIITNGKVCTLH